MDTNKMVESREPLYGSFEGVAQVAQDLKNTVRHYYRPVLDDDHKEAIEIILNKIARIINGDPNYLDSWRDIAGYATLIVKAREHDDGQSIPRSFEGQASRLTGGGTSTEPNTYTEPDQEADMYVAKRRLGLDDSTLLPKAARPRRTSD